MDTGWEEDNDDGLAALVHRCARGDRAALHELYEQQAPRLKSVAWRITGSPILAEDVLHDVFLQLWQQAGKFDPARGTPRAWITGLTRYRALTILRQRGREISQATPPEEIDDAPDALMHLAARADKRALDSCLATLNANARRMILLAFIEGRTHTQLADMLQIPLGTVKSTIRRALASLRECLGP